MFKQPEWMEKWGWVKGGEGDGEVTPAEGRGPQHGSCTHRPSDSLLEDFSQNLLCDLHINSETPHYSQAADNESLGLVADTASGKQCFWTILWNPYNF